MKRFNVLIPKEDGGVEVYPMKEWLRQHPDHMPPGLDGASSTSHELRIGLKKRGWSVALMPIAATGSTRPTSVVYCLYAAHPYSRPRKRGVPLIRRGPFQPTGRQSAQGTS